MEIPIIGGGIGGLCTAIALQKEGFEVKVYESAPHLHPLGAGLVLSSNAMKVFKELGIEKEVIQEGKVLKFLNILDEKGEIISSRDTSKVTEKFGLDNFTIHRADLHRILLKILKKENVKLGHRLKSLQQNNGSIQIEFENGEHVSAALLVAADGIHSAARKTLLPESNLRYAGYKCWRAVIDRIPPNFNQNSFSETWGKKGRFGIVPLGNDRIYWYACINAGIKEDRFSKFTNKDLFENFKTYHFPIRELIESTNNDQLILNDIIDLKPIKKYAFGNIVLIGDAAHATTPNLGQGACQAIEDALFLARCLKKYSNSVQAFNVFEKIRINRTSQIVKASWNIGRIAQMENNIACKIRNRLMKCLPQSITDKQLKFLYDIDFNKF